MKPITRWLYGGPSRARRKSTGWSSALCITVLVGPVGGEGGVGGVGDGGGAGWPISIIQHLKCKAPVARPRGLAPSAENEGE